MPRCEDIDTDDEEVEIESKSEMCDDCVGYLLCGVACLRLRLVVHTDFDFGFVMLSPDMKHKMKKRRTCHNGY